MTIAYNKELSGKFEEQQKEFEKELQERQQQLEKLKINLDGSPSFFIDCSIFQLLIF